MARNDSLVRVLRLARILADSRRGLPLKTIAQRHDWHLRTLYRDIEAIEAAGFPVIKEEDRFRLPPDALSAPPEKLQPAERLALFSARTMLSGMRWTATGRALESLWQRLTGDRQSAGLLVPTEPSAGLSVRSTLAIDYTPHQRTIEALEAAIAERRVVTIAYDALSTGESTTRDVEPMLLHWDATLEALYLVAWCRMRDALRVFAVHRIRLVSTTRAQFDARQGRAQAALKDAFRVWRSGNVETVRVRLRGWAAREAFERRIHASQEVERLGPDEARLTLRVNGLEEVTRWVLGFGALALVEAPDALVDRVRDEHVRALDRQRAPAQHARGGPNAINRKQNDLI